MNPPPNLLFYKGSQGRNPKTTITKENILTSKADDFETWYKETILFAAELLHVSTEYIESEFLIDGEIDEEYLHDTLGLLTGVTAN